ncbi:hypothetical protein [Rothia nasimurium]|nr:hypothetical protein [Rothia nasimurium]
MPTRIVGTPRLSWALSASGRRWAPQRAGSVDAGGAGVRSRA